MTSKHLVLPVLALLALSACGDSGADATDTADSVPATVAADTTPATVAAAPASDGEAFVAMWQRSGVDVTEAEADCVIGDYISAENFADIASLDLNREGFVPEAVTDGGLYAEGLDVCLGDDSKRSLFGDLTNTIVGSQGATDEEMTCITDAFVERYSTDSSLQVLIDEETGASEVRAITDIIEGCGFSPETETPE